MRGKPRCSAFGALVRRVSLFRAVAGRSIASPVEETEKRSDGRDARGNYRYICFETNSHRGKHTVCKSGLETTHLAQKAIGIEVSSVLVRTHLLTIVIGWEIYMDSLYWH